MSEETKKETFTVAFDIPIRGHGGKPMTMLDGEAAEGCPAGPACPHGKDASGQIEKRKRRPVTLRDVLLLLLASYDKTHGKEAFTHTECGLQIGDEAVNAIELSLKRVTYLRKIAQDNRTRRDDPILVPHIYVQVLQALGVDEENVTG